MYADSITDSTKINANPHMQAARVVLSCPNIRVAFGKFKEENPSIQKSKLVKVESKRIASLLSALLGYAVSQGPKKGDSVRENQFNKFMNKEVVQKENKKKSQKVKGLRQILSHVAKKEKLTSKEKTRLMKQALVELEKNAPPQPGLVFDEAKGRWVKPENRGKAVHALQGDKRLRGARIGSEKLNVGGTLQRLPKGTRQKVRGKLSQTLPKSLQRRGVSFRKK